MKPEAVTRMRWFAGALLLAGLAAPVLHAWAQPSDETGAVATKKKKEPYRRSKLTRSESEGTADRRDILLTIGEDYTVDLDFEPQWDNIVIGNPTVVGHTNVKPKKQLILKPLKDGETTIQIRDPEGNLKLVLDLSVTKSNLVRRAREIRDLLREVEGVKVRVVGQRIEVTGEVLTSEDFSQVLTVLKDKAYAEYIIPKVRLSPIALELLARRIQEEVNKFAPKVTTRVVNKVILVEGVVDAQDKVTLVEKTVNLYAPNVLPGVPPSLGGDTGVRTRPADQIPWVDIRVTVDMGGPPPGSAPAVPEAPPPPAEPQQVRITVHFVELSKDYSKIFGFKWQPGFTADPQITVGTGAGGSAAAGGASFTGTISSLFPKLRSASFAGFARVLKTVTVVTLDGSQASVSQDTTIPLIALGVGGVPTNLPPQKVTFALRILPKITEGTDSIRLDVDPFTQSAVVGKTTTGAAITSSSTIQTRFYMNMGESAAIAAFSTTDIGTDFNKDDPRAQTAGSSAPAAGADPSQPAAQIEPLFTLLSSKAYRKKKSQVVVFITPEHIKNPSSDTEDLKKNFRVRVNTK